MLNTFISLTTRSQYPELNIKHITMAFMPAQDTRYLYVNILADLLPCKTIVLAVKYYPGANCTVATVAITDKLMLLKQYIDGAGWTYTDYSWEPHITISSGNTVEEHAKLIGTEVTLTDATIRIKTYN